MTASGHICALGPGAGLAPVQERVVALARVAAPAVSWEATGIAMIRGQKKHETGEKGAEADISAARANGNENANTRKTETTATTDWVVLGAMRSAWPAH